MKRFRIENAVNRRLAIISTILLSLCWQSVLAKTQVAESVSQPSTLSQQTSDVDTVAFSKYHWDFSPSARSLQLQPQNEDPVDHFDINRFLEEFDNLDCTRNSEKGFEMTNALCESRLATDTLAPLGRASTSHEDVYNYLQNEIYQPLAHDSEKKENLSDMLIDVMDLTSRELSDNNPGQTLTFSGFQNGVMNVFDELATKTNDVKANEEQIRKNSIDILKKFHLYWNLMRTQGQLDQVKDDTKQVIQTLILNYKVKKEFQNVILRALLAAIVKAYYRFLKAHKILNLISKQGDKIMASQIISRYQNIMDKILGGRYSDVFMVKEASYMISLMQGFFVVSFKQGVQEAVIKANLSDTIIDPIRALYEQKENQLEGGQIDETNLMRLRDFTAVMLLKFRHMTFIMCNINDLTHYINMPQVNFIRSKFAIELYYRMFDSFYLIPQKCANFLLLKRCVVMESTKILRSVATSLNLRRSTFGWYFLQEVNSMMKSMYSSIDDTTWQNWGLFKEYFYQNLFATMYNYKKIFQVGDMDLVENLEQTFSDAIEKFKQKEQIRSKPDLFDLVDKLDKKLYKQFITIKARYNRYTLFERDEFQVMNVKRHLYRWITKRKMEPDFKGKVIFDELFDNLLQTTDEWAENAVSVGETSFNIGPPALAPTVQEFTLDSTNPTELELTPTRSNKAVDNAVTSSKRKRTDSNENILDSNNSKIEGQHTLEQAYDHNSDRSHQDNGSPDNN